VLFSDIRGFTSMSEKMQPEEVVAFLRDSVATYKLPEMLEIFGDFPFTPTGKIQRHVLQRRVLERRGA